MCFFDISGAPPLVAHMQVRPLMPGCLIQPDIMNRFARARTDTESWSMPADKEEMQLGKKLIAAVILILTLVIGCMAIQ